MIALIWCAIALSYFDNLEGLSAAITNGGPGNVVYASSFGLLGVVGGVLAFLGVVILPITSGDTAFRSSRLIMAEYFNVEQKGIRNRLFMAAYCLCLAVFLPKSISALFGATSDLPTKQQPS